MDTEATPDMKDLMEMLFRVVGVDCSGESEGDTRDENGLLICGVCGSPKEVVVDVPYIGLRKHPIICECGNKLNRMIEEREQIEREQARVDALSMFSITGKRFEMSTFANCKVVEQNERAVRIAKRYVDLFDEMFARGKGLLLYGPTSTGKTFLSSCIANALLEKRVPLIVTSLIKLTGNSSIFSKDAANQRNFLRGMNNARLLILDDFGAERDTEYKMEQVYEIIDTRYESKRPMIITTNLSLQEMQDDKDRRRKRIYERIQEVCFPVAMYGPSWRINTAADDYDEIKRMLNG